MNQSIEQLLEFGLENKMITKWDVPMSRNLMLSLLNVSEPFEGDVAYEKGQTSPSTILNKLLDEAVEAGLIEDTVTARDILDAKIMATMMPRPSELNRQFDEIKEKEGLEAATDFFYAISRASNYIRVDRVSKNLYWTAGTDYGDLEITVNLSKPEKDPKEIAAAKLAPQSNYPKCFLCLENVGYEGRANHPARTNHRVIPMTLEGEQWFIQYSPYVYYNEHAIIFKGAHEPMKICKDTFKRLLGFVEQFPHYFLGSNADLPIVGGSILSHDHFQGGHHTFPMEIAENIYTTTVDGYEGVNVSMVKWPLSVIRLSGKDRAPMVELADHILGQWRGYSDESLGIFAFSGETPHNTITPISRINKAGEFELDLVLRNNRQSDEHPDGIFHPHAHLHHIKKENIGLIEVMGLAVLPARLKEELGHVEAVLTSGKASMDEVFTSEEVKAKMEQHRTWIEGLVASKGTNLTDAEAKTLVEAEVGRIFSDVLDCAGVYKQDDAGIEGMKRFIGSL